MRDFDVLTSRRGMFRFRVNLHVKDQKPETETGISKYRAAEDQYPPLSVSVMQIFFPHSLDVDMAVGLGD